MVRRGERREGSGGCDEGISCVYKLRNTMKQSLRTPPAASEARKKEKCSTWAHCPVAGVKTSCSGGCHTAYYMSWEALGGCWAGAFMKTQDTCKMGADHGRLKGRRGFLSFLEHDGDNIISNVAFPFHL